MLVITRRIQESVFVNKQEIKVVVLGVQGNRVKLGFEAPREVSIQRGEKYGNVLEFPAHCQLEMTVDPVLTEVAAIAPVEQAEEAPAEQAEEAPAEQAEEAPVEQAEEAPAEQAEEAPAE
jgi:carbon storage regulator CsrA